MSNPTAEVALKLCFAATNPNILAMLVPMAAPAYVLLPKGDTPEPSLGATVKLTPADARRLATQSKEVASMVAFLTDDAEALTLLSETDLSTSARKQVMAHPNLSKEAFVRISAGESYSTFDSSAFMRPRLLSFTPDLAFADLAFDAKNYHAVWILCSQENLTAAAALKIVKSLKPEIEPYAGAAKNMLLSREDFATIFAREENGSLSTKCLKEHLTKLYSLSKRSTDVRAPIPARRVLQKIFASTKLGLDSFVTLDLVEEYIENPIFQSTFAFRKDLEATLCVALWEKMYNQLLTDYESKGITEKALLDPEGLTYLQKRDRAEILAPLHSIAANMECPSDIIYRLPIWSEDLSPLMRILPEDPRMWDVAVALLADEPSGTWGSFKETISAILA